MITALISALVTLFVVIDPIGLGPIFLGLTTGLPQNLKRKIGLEACVIAFFVLAGSALFGDWLLTKLGISLAAFRIAGGLLLFAIAFEMVFERRVERKADQSVGAHAHIAAFPLAIPLMAGPGAITAMVLLAGRMNGVMGLSLLIAAMAAMLLAAYAVFLTSSYLERFLGTQGQAVFGRLLGVLLAALAVQYVADGVLALGASLT
ncbi:MAG: MarC family protein [Alphaproteobacteria bacterium]|jgi:multiple antibiotic resistance protein|nr:MarC family protein [Alphaproteobacteria bacterium]